MNIWKLNCTNGRQRPRPTMHRHQRNEPTTRPPESTGAGMMADVTYYVAMPFMQDDSGSPMAGAAEECQSPTTALRRAEMMSRMAGSIGAVAFSRSGDPMIGEFGDAKLLRKFGNVPDDLSGL